VGSITRVRIAWAIGDIATLQPLLPCNFAAASVFFRMTLSVAFHRFMVSSHAAPIPDHPLMHFVLRNQLSCWK
jgi:hypothetical protein